MLADAGPSINSLSFMLPQECLQVWGVPHKCLWTGLLILQFQLPILSPLKSPTGHYHRYVACKWARSPVLTWQPYRSGGRLWKSMCGDDEGKVDLSTSSYILWEDFQSNAKAPSTLGSLMLKPYCSSAFLPYQLFLFLARQSPLSLLRGRHGSEQWDWGRFCVMVMILYSESILFSHDSGFVTVRCVCLILFSW